MTASEMMELMGSATTEAEADAMIRILAERGLDAKTMDDSAFFALIPEAVERANLEQGKVEKPGVRTIADCSQDDGHAGLENAANARLIAAAPDLFACAIHTRDMADRLRTELPADSRQHGAPKSCAFRC